MQGEEIPHCKFNDWFQLQIGVIEVKILLKGN
jgi:hypothetical protein